MEALYTGIGWGIGLLGAGLGFAAIIAALGLSVKWSNR